MTITRLADERGSSLIISMLAVLLLTALSAALVLTTNTEVLITKNFKSTQQALYGTDAGIERSIQDLLREPAWGSILNGAIQSGFTDDPPRAFPNGAPVDLTALTGALQADSDALYGGTNPDRPVWQIYAHGPLDDLIPNSFVPTRGYVLVWVADDPGEADGAPAVDSNGTVILHAEGYGEGASRKVIEATAVRTFSAGGESGYVAQRGQDEQNRRARKDAVSTPGSTLDGVSMTLKTGGLS